MNLVTDVTLCPAERFIQYSNLLFPLVRLDMRRLSSHVDPGSLWPWNLHRTPPPPASLPGCWVLNLQPATDESSRCFGSLHRSLCSAAAARRRSLDRGGLMLAAAVVLSQKRQGQRSAAARPLASPPLRMDSQSTRQHQIPAAGLTQACFHSAFHRISCFHVLLLFSGVQVCM